jgi:hypothetical protein
MKKLLVFFLLTLLFLACEKRPTVVFQEPQPNTSKDEASFRNNVQGKYFNEKDSSFILVTDKSVVRILTLKYKFSKSGIDSSSQININDDNSIISGLRKDGIEARIIQDSIFGISVVKDTLFNISGDHRLRTFKGYYFLNTRIRENAYHVLRMDLIKKKYLKFSEIHPSDSLDRFQTITPINKIFGDSVGESGRVVQYNMSPTKKELKRLMKEEAFIEDDEVYVKTEN